MFKPTLRQLEYFYALTKTLSFSLAAQESHVGQSTLSASIKDLEQGIGFSLFERTSRRVFLTSEGEEFLQTILPLLDQQESILDKIKALQTPLGRTIRLGIIPTIAPFMLPSLLQSDTNFSFREGLSTQLIEDLEEKRIDMALLALPYPLKPHIKTQILFEDPLYLARPPSLSDTLPFLFLEDGHCLRDQAILSCQITPDLISSQFKGTSLNSVLSLVQNGQGQTLIPHMSLPFFEHLQQIEFSPYDGASRTIALVWTHKKHTDQVQELAKEIG